VTDVAPTGALLNAVHFSGVRSLPVSKLHAAIADLLGRPLDASTLDALRRRVQSVYDAAGLGLMRVHAPTVFGNQGILLLRVEELRLHTVQITRTNGADGRADDPAGLDALTEARVLGWLPSLSVGDSPSLQRLNRELFLLNDNPRLKAAVDFRADDQGRLHAQVDVHTLPLFYGHLALDNSGSKASGEGRLRAQLAHADVGGLGAIGELGLSTSLDGRRVRQALARLALPTPSTGGQVEMMIDHSSTDLGAVLAFNEVSGQSTGLRLAYKHPWERSEMASHFLSMGLAIRRHADVYDFFGINLGSKVASQAVSLGLFGQGQGEIGWRYELALTANIPGGADNDDVAYAASRSGARADWSRFNLQAEAQRGLGSGWTGRVRGMLQRSPAALISAEQFRTGGADLLRGLIDGELAGDSGAAVAFELVAPSLFIGESRTEGIRWQPLVFVEWGGAYRNQLVSGLTGVVQAATVGAGVQVHHGSRWQLDLGFGRVLASKNLPESSRGDIRAHAALRMLF
jgi:hemolysin activation/secretion protein